MRYHFFSTNPQLVELMGGRFWVESAAPFSHVEEDRSGSVFHFTLSFGLSKGTAKRSPATLSALKSLRVLVVDDNSTNRRILVDTLTKWQMNPSAVDSGREALSQMKRSAAEQAPYKLVVLDAQMPEMDGFLVAEIRQRETALGAHTPIIAMTAYAMKGDLERCLAAGMDAYISKPINARELLQAIDDLLPLPTPLDTICSAPLSSNITPTLPR